MECIEYLSSYEEVKKLVDEVQRRRISYLNIMEHYRGQGRPEYKLIPFISRNLKSAEEVQNKEEYLMSYVSLELQNKAIDHIIRQDTWLNSGQNNWNTLFQLQHFGIPTRLLDWSLSWEVGLWFAVENSKNDNVDGQLWVFTVPDKIHSTDSRDNFYQKDLCNLDKTYLINAPIYFSPEKNEQIGEVRRERQFGKFSISSYGNSIIPLEEQPEIKPYLEKYCIPANFKKQIRQELELRGIRGEYLYYRDANLNILEKLDKITKTSP